MNGMIKQKVDFSINELSSQEQIAFYEYWLSLKGDKVLPSRSDFNPMKIPKSLPFIIMEEVCTDPVQFKIRLIGSKCKTPGIYLGKFTNDIAEMKDITEMLEKALKFKKLYFYFNSIKHSIGNFELYSSLVLPFSEDGENINILMACHCQLQ